MKKLLAFALGLSFLAPVSLLARAPLGDAATALAAESAPRLEIMLGDEGSSDPNLPGDCTTHTYGWGDDVRDTGGGNVDSDCIRVRIANPDARYTQDFRFCLNFFGDGGEQCTRWASEGGGESSAIVSPRGAFGRAAVRTQTRALGGGGYLTNLGASVRLAYLQSGENRCGASSGSVVASASGSPESLWAYGAQKDDDPGCGWIGISSVTHVAPYRAAFAGSNLSGAELSASTTYPVSRDFRIVMRNTGISWNSGAEVSRTGDCDDYEPGFGAAPCSYTKVVTADNVRLERIDTTPFVFDASRLQYRQEITVTHRSVQEVTCRGGGGVTPAPVITRLLGIPTAYAVEQVGGEDGDPCQPSSRWTESVTETPAAAIIAPGTALFPAGFRTPAAAGEYVLRFQMVKTDGAAEGTDASGRFGEVAEIPVTITGPDARPGVGISCPVAELEARAGSVATYSVSLSSRDGFAGAVQVTPSGMPSGATSPGAAATLAAGGSASALVPITIPAGTPAGRSTVTFTATGAGVEPAVCRSDLVVIRGPEDAPTLVVRPAAGRVTVGETAAFEAYYDPDGTGPRADQQVTSASSWSIDSAAAVIAGAGRFQGVVVGSGNIRASYLGLSAPATLTVEDADGTTPTLVVRPASQTVAIGAQAQYNAYYDPDGPGTQVEQQVAATAAWASGSSIATSNGAGRFTGVHDGSGTVAAHYLGLSASAAITVGGGDFLPALDVRPASRQVAIGAQAQFDAYYDPDGLGPQGEEVATAPAQWFITDSVAANDGAGRFTGSRNGTAGVEARHLGLSDAASLVVGSGSSATLAVRPSSRRIDIGETGTFQAYYDPDGPGTLPERDVTDEAAWDIGSSVASNGGDGRFTGNREGSASVEATHLGLRGTASLTVGDDDGPEAGATLRVSPDAATIAIGQQATFQASYDPDGAGGQPERLVTVSSTWSSDSGAARSDGSGRFTGTSDGTAGVDARYRGLSDSASLRVGTGGSLSCTFTANPMTLFIPPARSTTLTWNCNQPTSCTVSNVTRSRAVGSGSETGTAADQPAETTTYRLSCGGGAYQQDLTVRVFDVTTRVEILPR